jgi:UDP-2-acetamido-2-deoxy-ribo-hexuluronate aminotransferase
MRNDIEMVDLKKQYHRLKTDIDKSIAETLEKGRFIKGPDFVKFQEELSAYLQGPKVIACANGTDALQIAMMALGLKPGDEVIVPAFTYIATAEVIGLLGLKPIIVDVDPDTFNCTAEHFQQGLSDKTKLLVPVHLFGQCAHMRPILSLAENHNLAVIEDAAQAIGAKYTFANGTSAFAGCMGDMGTTSFFPSKNLGCFGDGGAIFSSQPNLVQKATMIANHGQATQYVHETIGVNSRLDELQAGILRVKLKQLDDFAERRNAVARFYDQHLSSIQYLNTPRRQAESTHVFHQYTLKVKDGLRDNLKAFLQAKGIPSMVYYPMPLHHQKAFKEIGKTIGNLEVSVQLCKEVLSLPIHTEMEVDQMAYIVENIIEFFENK